MVFLNIGNTKLKVTLTEQECARYGIDTAKSEFTRSEIKEVMRDILTLCEDSCGFCVTSEKILVQLYPMPGGECEIFVTKLTGLAPKDRGMLKGVDGLRTLERKRGIYRFDSRDDLIRAARAIRDGNAECELYLDDAGEYYLAIKEEITDGISEYEVLIEFADRLCDIPIRVLSEYGRCISKVNTLEKIISGEI